MRTMLLSIVLTVLTMMNTLAFFYIWFSSSHDYMSSVMFWLSSFIVFLLFPFGVGVYIKGKKTNYRQKFIGTFCFLIQSISFVMVVVPLYWEVSVG